MVGKLVWAAIGFAAAALGAEYILPIPGLPYLAAALAAFSPAVLLFKKPYRRPALTLLLAAALGLGWWWGYYALHVAPCEALAGEDVTVTARVTEYPRAGDGYTRVTVRLTDGAPREKAYLYLYDEELPALRPGDEIEAEIRVRPVMDRGATDLHANTAAGIHLRGYFRGDIAVVGRWKYAGLYFPQEIGQYVKNACADLFPGRLGVFMKALLTGDKQELYDDAELYGDMRAAGVLHMVAVSGMHIFILIGFVQLLFGRRHWMRFACVPLVAVFVLMTGAGASVLRAAIMQGLYMLAPLLGRESDSASSISAAALLELLANPMAVGGVGMQLSYACVLGFVVFLPRMYEWMGRTRLTRYRAVRYARSSLASSFSATIFSVPVAAHYFGAVPLLSPLANILAIPVIEVCFAGGYIVCLLNALLPPLARAGAWVLAWGARYCLLVFRFLGRLPFSCLYTMQAGAVLWLFFAYALLLWWWIARGRGRYLHAGIPASLGLIGLCLVFLWNLGGLTILDRHDLAVLDVGQGQCAAVYDGGAAVVVDCGGTGLMNAGDTAADHLRSVGVRAIDALVLTHLHEDHTNGVETLLYRLPVRRLYIPADADDGDGRLVSILAAADRYGTEVVLLYKDETVTIGDIALTMVLPQAGTDENERGIVALAAYGAQNALIMGDAGTDAELALLDKGFAPRTEILVAGHHGSKTASGALYLQAIRPGAAVVSVGKNNTYGLPAAEVMERLKRYCGAVYRTDTDGTVVISMKENG